VTVIADTGALYALIDASDAWHGRVLEWWKINRLPVVVPVTVIPELTWLLQTRIGPAAEAAFIRAVVDGEFTIEQLESTDIIRAAELVEGYADLPLGFTDASIVAVAERLEAREILTTDRRHFGVVPPRKGRFVLLP
jgi:predicted nucleic acid-binding protein